ncbi:MAG TPA: YncE family protein [Myxococcales bacterium]|nr:YncE family protein [Myxococcales bacterium]
MNAPRWSMSIQLAAAGLLLLAAASALADPFVLATGRRDPRIYAIDLKAALSPKNNDTPNAIVSRSHSSPRHLDGRLLGDPANIVLSDDQRTAFVMNHHGAVDNAEFLQHGGRASVAVMNVRKMLDRRLDDTSAALEHVFDGGWFGGVGLVILPDLIVAGYSENWLSEDGSNRIGLIDRRTGGLVGQIEMALVGPGTRQLTSPCPSFPVPFVSPTPPPVVPFLSLDLAFGCWPDPEGLALAHGSDGRTYLVSGNAGTEDVSVMDLDKALAGGKVVEVAPRIPVQSGPFGIKASPNGKFVAVTARESNRVDFEGNTISIIDIDRARQGLSGGEAARVRVGTDDAGAGARPFTVAWTPDGRSIVVANFRTNNVSVVDLALALAGKPGAEVARIPLVRPDGRPARPKGIAVTSDGRYAVVSGGARQPPNAPASGTVFVIDLRTRKQVATVTGVGNDPYGLTIVDHVDDD